MENAVYFDDTITIVEAYYEAVRAIREGMGESSYFLMCGGLYYPIIGLVDAQRTGSNVLSMWSSAINKDGKAAPYTMKQMLDFLLEKNMLPSYCNESDKYTVCDYYGKVYKTDVKVGDKVTLGVLKPHGATVIKIEKQSGQTIIVESTGHYSMGAEEIHMAIKDGSFVIQYDNTFDWPIEYKVMLPAGYVTEEGEGVITVQIPPLQKICRGVPVNDRKEG